MIKTVDYYEKNEQSGEMKSDCDWLACHTRLQYTGVVWTDETLMTSVFAESFLLSYSIVSQYGESGILSMK